MTVRIVTWNTEWAEPETERGCTVMEVLDSTQADVIVLTEGCQELLPANGFVVDGGTDWGYEVKDARRRKVIMWSRNMWTSPSLGNENLPSGRFVEAKTSTPIGDLKVFGVCIPWRDAHVRTGQKNRKTWEDHLTYLNALAPHLNDNLKSLVVAGDYNQRIPRGRAPHHVFDELTETFKDLKFASDGVLDDPLIDHVAHTHDMMSTYFEVIPATLNGQRLTDHRGLIVDIDLCV